MVIQKCVRTARRGRRCRQYGPNLLRVPAQTTPVFCKDIANGVSKDTMNEARMFA